MKFFVGTNRNRHGYKTVARHGAATLTIMAHVRMTLSMTTQRTIGAIATAISITTLSNVRNIAKALLTTIRTLSIMAAITTSFNLSALSKMTHTPIVTIMTLNIMTVV
jgi:hypothetical protein